MEDSPLNGTSHHNEGDDEDDELTKEETAPPPGDVSELTASCVRFVGAKYGTVLDFLPETLSFVDQYVRDVRADIGARPEAQSLVTGAIGAYLGEVIRLRFGGYWYVEGPHPKWRVQLSRVFLSFNPIGMALEAITLTDAEGWGAHLAMDADEVVEQRLAALPEVPHDEYVLPTTRYDTLDIVVSALREHMRATGTADVRFTPDDYA